MGLFPEFARRMLEIDEEQGKKLTALQADVDKRLADVLTEDQRKQLAQPPRFFGGPPGGPGPDGPRDGGDRRPGPRRGFRPPRFGEVIPGFAVETLKLTNEQESKIADVQSDVDAQLEEILTDEQRERVDNMGRGMARGPGFGPPGDRPPGDRRRPDNGPDGGPPDGDRPPRRDRPERGPDDARPPDGRRPDGDRPPRGGPGGGGPQMFGGGPGGMFRSYRYSPDFPGLVGKDLTPGDNLAEVVEKTQRRPPDGDRPQPPNP
jgi:hypothetical protein